MKIRTKIILAVVSLAFGLCLLFAVFIYKQIREAAWQNLDRTMGENMELLRVVNLSPLEAGDRARLHANLNAFLENPLLVGIVLISEDGLIEIGLEKERLDEKRFIRNPIEISRNGQRLGTVTAWYDARSIESKLKDIRVRIVIWVWSFMGLLWLLVYLAVTRFTRPIIVLTEASKAMADGDLEREIVSGSKDEIGTLAHSFSVMRNSIRDKIIGLAEKNATLHQEISERLRMERAMRESEEQYRLLIEHYSAGVVVFSPWGKIKMSNLRARELLGIEGRITGDEDRTWLFFREDDSPLPTNEYPATRVMLTGKEVLEQVVYIKHGMDKTWLTVNAYPHYNESGRLRNVIVSFLDITEMRKAETENRRHRDQLEELVEARTRALVRTNHELEQEIIERRKTAQALIRAKAEAESANQAKSEFLANMSHEIRTPINAITGFCHLALQTRLTEQQRDYLLKVRTASHTLLGIIDDILDFSKIEAGKLNMEQTVFDLGTVLEDLANLVVAGAVKKRLEVLFHCPNNIPRVLVGDPLRLRQVLTNLTSNAVKFTEQGEILVTVKLVSRTDTRVVLRFDIRDTGIGLHPEQMERLFVSFSQADTSTTRKYGGTGLGLAISKQLVSMMNGEIDVRSRPGEGSTFYFTAVFGIGPEKSAAQLDPDLYGKRVLVADDNDTSREIIYTMLDGFHLQPTLAGNGQEALEACVQAAEEGNPFDLVLLDWIMPEMDGIEAAGRICVHPALKPRPSIIMMTAHDREELTHRVEAAHLSGLLAKPVSPSALLEAVTKAFGREISRTAKSTVARRSSTAAHHLRGARVLLTEDNATNQQVALEMLTSLGLEVAVAEDGLQAVEQVRQNPPDLVLMDIQMPRMDGYQAAQAIRKNAKLIGMPIIAMTAHAMASDRDRCLASGMDDHLAKPIDPDLLAAMLCKWLPERGFQVPIRFRAIESGSAVLPDHLPGFDMKKILDRIRGNRELYRKLLLDFYEDWCDARERLEHASNKGDHETLAYLAHTLKGTSGTLGADGLMEACKQLEDKLKRGLPETLPRSLTDALKEVMTSIESLEKEVTEDKYSHDPAASSKILEALAGLDHFLARGNTEAFDHLERVKQLVGKGWDTHYQILADQVQDYAFEAARQTLARISATV